jgi:hypothetical protein
MIVAKIKIMKCFVKIDNIRSWVLRTEDLLLMWTYDFLADAEKHSQWTASLLRHASDLIDSLPHDSFVLT